MTYGRMSINIQLHLANARKVASQTQEREPCPSRAIIHRGSRRTAQTAQQAAESDSTVDFEAQPDVDPIRGGLSGGAVVHRERCREGVRGKIVHRAVEAGARGETFARLFLRVYVELNNRLLRVIRKRTCSVFATASPPLCSVEIRLSFRLPS